VIANPLSVGPAAPCPLCTAAPLACSLQHARSTTPALHTLPPLVSQAQTELAMRRTQISGDVPTRAMPHLGYPANVLYTPAAFCQVHAVNNSHGHRVMTGQRLLMHCHRLADHNLAWGQAYEPVVGNFSVAAIDHWLFHNTVARMVYQPWAHLVGEWQQDSGILSKLAANGYASCVVQLSQRDHAAALQCSTEGTWLLLDSAGKAPCQLSPAPYWPRQAACV
jgi:hypothetical protein